jgi:hypothetical protein
LIRAEKAREVFLLFRRIDDYNRRERKSIKNGKKVIRRKAGDDWF